MVGEVSRVAQSRSAKCTAFVKSARFRKSASWSAANQMLAICVVLSKNAKVAGAIPAGGRGKGLALLPPNAKTRGPGAAGEHSTPSVNFGSYITIANNWFRQSPARGVTSLLRSGQVTQYFQSSAARIKAAAPRERVIHSSEKLRSFAGANVGRNRAAALFKYAKARGLGPRANAILRASISQVPDNNEQVVTSA
jgi:hypothetical protein